LTLILGITAVFLGAAAAAATVQISLTFGKGREVRIVQKDDLLSASAEIQGGTGPFKGFWEVAGPLSHSGSDLVFREIGRFYEKTDDAILLLKSPDLPTEEAGSYTLRLRVLIGASIEYTKVVKYFVGHRPSRDLLGGKTEVPEVLQAVNPSERTSVTASSTLSWDPVPGSLAFQVEIFDKTGDESGISTSRAKSCIIRLSSKLNRQPVTALMVPAYQTEVRLKDLESRRLRAGISYLWRVVAIDRDGRALCESPLGEFLYGGATQ